MIGFKYRGNSKANGYSDLQTLLQHELYAPTFSMLNDPFEATFDDQIQSVVETLKGNSGLVTQQILESWRRIQKYKDGLGIYSLERQVSTSYSPSNELLWAHYANGHRGFCIEYDIDKIIDSYKPFWEINKTTVEYNKVIPQLSIRDLDKLDLVLQKMLGSKSEAWRYENEVRLIYDTSGTKSYHPSALKSVYFGLLMDVQQQNDIIRGLENFDVCFFRMEKITNTYQVKAIKIDENKRKISNRLSNLEYRVIKTMHQPTVENFHILLLTPNRELEYLKNFVEKFREEYSTKPSNILLYDDDIISDLIGKYPLYGAEQTLFADHLIAMSTFEIPEYVWMYPDK